MGTGGGSATEVGSRPGLSPWQGLSSSGKSAPVRKTGTRARSRRRSVRRKSGLSDELGLEPSENGEPASAVVWSLHLAAEACVRMGELPPIVRSAGHAATGGRTDAERPLRRPARRQAAKTTLSKIGGHIHMILHRAFRDAVRWNLLSRNPSDLADPPRARQSEQVRERTWSSTEVARFLQATGPSRHAPLWRLLATTGMRRGEALGLRWADVDLANRRLSVNRTLIQSHDYASGDTGAPRRRPADDERSRSTRTPSLPCGRTARTSRRSDCASGRPTTTRTWCSAPGSASRFTRRWLRICSGKLSRRASCLTCRCMAFGTPGQHSPCRPASTPRSSKSG